MTNLHPLFQAILKPYAPPSPAPAAIDAAMLADKLNDGYFKRQVANAIKLEKL
jgi:hypothetical protein